MIFQNSILLDGDILGVFGDKNIDAELIRMDLKSGKIHWREKMPGTRGSSLMVGDQMVILSETGDIICGEPAKSGWTEHGRVKALVIGQLGTRRIRPWQDFRPQQQGRGSLLRCELRRAASVTNRKCAWHFREPPTFPCVMPIFHCV
jgi:hypothetical protein